MTGRIDVHSHLLPGVDDGCKTVADSIACAREMVAAGYTHSFCTPHFWPDLRTSVTSVRQWTAQLQRDLDAAHVPLTLFPGGEINLRPGLSELPPEEILTYGTERRYALFDLWADELPAFFEPEVRWLQSLGLTLVIAHPERMKAVQSKPELAEYFADLGLLMQGNLQCLGDPPEAPTRRLAERYLADGRYFMLGSDLHNLKTLDVRLNGLRRAIEAVGTETCDRLTKTNPAKLLPSGVVA